MKKRKARESADATRHKRKSRANRERKSTTAESVPSSKRVTAEVLLYKRNRKQKGAPRQEPAAASSTAYVSDINREYARLLQSKEDLFNAIHEIIANLIGCEEIGIFRIDEGCKLSLVSSRGLDTEQFQRIPLGSSLIGKTLLSEDIYFGGEIAGNFRLPQEANLSACIPGYGSTIAHTVKIVKSAAQLG